MKTKFTIFILCWIFPQIHALAQASFFKEILYPFGSSISGISYSEIATDPAGFSFSVVDNSGYLSDSIGIDDVVLLFQLNLQGDIETVRALEKSDIKFSVPVSFDRSEADHAMIIRETLDSVQLMLLYANTQSNISWGRRLSLNQIPYTDLDFNSAGNIVASYYHDYILTNNVSPPKLGLVTVETSSGNSLFENYYSLSAPFTSDIYRTLEVEGNSNGTVSILGLTSNNNEPNYFILNLDNNGSILQSVGINDPNYKLSKIKSDQGGNIYITGRYLAYPDLGNFGHTCFIAKLNPNLELIWAKEIDVANFNCSAPKISISETGDVFFIYASNGNQPAILGQISSAGDLIWNKGYNFFAAQVSVQKVEQPYIISRRKYFPGGSFSNALLIATTDAQGNIDNCPQFNSCLNFNNFDIQFESWQWQLETGSALTPVSVTMSSLDFNIGSHCGMQIPPTPFFEIPDSVCVETCLEPVSYSNNNASLINWTISGPGIDSTIVDTTFLFCFNTPGSYIIEQEVWFLGCPEYFQQELTVLPNLLPIFNTSGFICDDGPFELSITADRPLLEIIWPDGSTGASYIIFENGEINVIIRDQFCEQTVSIDIVFLNNLLTGSVIFLPKDTTVCLDQLPFLLNLESPYTDNFELIGSEQTGHPFELSAAGNYTIYTNIHGCPIYESYNLEVDPCYGNIYLPNSFSPDNDGINDYWHAYGPDIELKNLQIFDRWGGLIYSDFSPPILWDGTGRENKKVNPGTYVFLINYTTIFDGKPYQESGDILILK